MKKSLNLGLFDVTKQNTKKIGIQDWLDGNNFSQASCGFEPLVVYADIHYSASNVEKPSQSDIDEDFVSVSQIVSRKKLTKPIKRNCQIISNFDAIEPYEENKTDNQSPDVNDTFDKIFHNGKKLTNVIKRTYPGKVKSKSKVKVNKRALQIQKDLFINKTTESNIINSNSVERDEPATNKTESGSQRRINSCRRKMSNQRLMSHKIKKKYFRRNTDKGECKINCKDINTKNNKHEAIDSRKNSKEKLSNKVRTLNRTAPTKGSINKNKTDTTEKIKDCSVILVKADTSLTKFNNNIKINNNNNKTSCATSLSSSTYNCKPVGMSYTEFKSIINSKPIVLAERLSFKGTKELTSLSSDSSKTGKSLKQQLKYRLNRIMQDSSNFENAGDTELENGKTVFDAHKDSVLDNLQTIGEKGTQKKFNNEKNKYIKSKPTNNISFIQNQAVNMISNQTEFLNVSNNIKETLFQNSNLKIPLTKRNTDNTDILKKTESEDTIINGTVEEFLELQSKFGCKDVLKITLQKLDPLTKSETNQTIVGISKSTSKAQDKRESQCVNTISVRENDVINNKFISKVRSERKKIKVTKNDQSTISSLKCNRPTTSCQSIISSLECNRIATSSQSTIRSLECNTSSVYNNTTLGNIAIKKVPMVLVKPLRICETERQAVAYGMIPLVKKLPELRKSSIECRESSVSKASYNKQELKELVIPIKVSEQKSPGWSRLERTKKDFSTPQKTRLNVSNGSKLLRSFNKINSSTDSSCRGTDKNCKRPPILKNKRIVKHLFNNKKKSEQSFSVKEINTEKKSNIKEKVDELKNYFNEIKRHSSEEKQLHFKRKSTRMAAYVCGNKQDQNLGNSIKRQKFTTATVNAPSHVNAHNVPFSTHIKAKNCSKSVSTMTASSTTIDVGIQTNLEMYVTCCTHRQQKEENMLPKKSAPGSDQLFCSSDRLTQTEDVSDKSKDSDIIMPSCETLNIPKDKTLSFSFAGNNCMDETFVDGSAEKKISDFINKENNCKQFNSEHLSRNILEKSNTTEKEHIISGNLFSSDSGNKFSGRTAYNMKILCSLGRPNNFSDPIPFKALNTVGQPSLDSSQKNKCSESVLNSKQVPSSGQTDDIFLTLNNSVNQCNNVNKQKCDNLNVNHMSDMETVEELYFLCNYNTRSLKNKSKTIDNDVNHTSQTADLINSPEDFCNKNKNFISDNVSKPTRKSESHSDNESLMSLSTVKLNDLTYTSLGTDLNYDTVVSSLYNESYCNTKMSSLENVKGSKTNVDSIENMTSKSIHHTDEFRSEVYHSNKKDASWSQNGQTVVPTTSWAEKPNTINISLLTEILDTQQQKHLGEECVQLAAQIQAMQKELNKNIQH